VRVDSLITGFLKNERAIRRATRKFVPIARFASLWYGAEIPYG